MNTAESEVVTLKVRVTPSFREQIQQAAKENNRSMNAEIVLRLEQSFNAKHHQDNGLNAIASRLDSLELQLADIAKPNKK